MSLKEIELNTSYRSGRDDLVRDFYNPCLESSILYRRSAGYFTSAGLALAARGVARLISGGGKMRLIASPHLESGDIEALQNAATNPVEVLARIAARSVSELEDALVQDRLNALAWLAASGGLEVKLALRLDKRGGMTQGLYHEKIGIFSDSEDQAVAFTGSSNETAGGLVENFESVEVFWSWQDPEGRVSNKIEDFERMWMNDTPGLKVIQFTDASKELLERFRNPHNPPSSVSQKCNNLVNTSQAKPPLEPPSWLELYDYQEEAIKAWVGKDGKGIFAMATGAGKTLTALSLACRVAKKNPPMVIVVVCPFINLCNQWMEGIATFNIRSIPCFEGKQRWETLLAEAYQSISTNVESAVAIVTTTRTFQSPTFQAKLRAHVKKQLHLLIADEVHNLGAAKIQKYLPDEIRLRVGLSATPERHMDPEGTHAIFDYFGDVIYEYPIERAISEGRLCPYYYYPHIVQLTDEEAIEYQEITEKIGRLFVSDKDSELGKVAMSLLIRRSRLLAGAENKIDVLDEVLRDLPEKPRKALFYCGDGRTTDKIADEEVRQIEAVSRLLGNKHGQRVRNFTYRENPGEREAILRDLGSGLLDGVVAIRCLDEGIDLPDLRIGFLLASSTNPRQFIQRRGRLLRCAKGKDFAIIHDFIIEPPDLGGALSDRAYNLERRFFRRELERIQDFCNTAENGQVAINTLKDLRLKYNMIS